MGRSTVVLVGDWRMQVGAVVAGIGGRRLPLERSRDDLVELVLLGVAVRERRLLEHVVLAGLQLVGRFDVRHVLELDLFVVLDHQAGLDAAFALVDQLRLGRLVRGRHLVGQRRVVHRWVHRCVVPCEVLVRLVGHVLLP